MNPTLRDYARKVAYVLIPLAALTGSYVGGRVHQQIRDQAVVTEYLDTTYLDRALGRDTPLSREKLHGNKKLEGMVLVSKAMADKNPVIYNLASIVDDATSGGKRVKKLDVIDGWLNFISGKSNYLASP